MIWEKKGKNIFHTGDKTLVSKYCVLHTNTFFYYKSERNSPTSENLKRSDTVYWAKTELKEKWRLTPTFQQR